MTGAMTMIKIPLFSWIMIKEDQMEGFEKYVRSLADEDRTIEEWDKLFEQFKRSDDNAKHDSD